MPKRPRSHQLDTLSRNRLHHIFEQLGWVVWDLTPDYGEDLLVRIFINDTATHYSFFIQAKATDHIDRYLKKENYLRFPIDTDHIRHWSQFWEPVILTVLDTTSNITYWEVIQDFLQLNPYENTRNKNVNIEIPISNILDENGLESILERTKARFERFEILSQGTEILIDVLENRFKVAVEYVPGESSMVLTNPSGKRELFLLGELQDMALYLAVKFNMSMEQVISEALFRAVVKTGLAFEEKTEASGVIVRTEDGKIFRSYETVEEYERVKREVLEN